MNRPDPIVMVAGRRGGKTVDLYAEIRGIVHAEIAELCERLVAEHGAAEAMKHLRASLEPVPCEHITVRYLDAGLRECRDCGEVGT